MSVHNIELHSDVAFHPVRRLSAGNLTCLYEKGNLRYIKCNGDEVVRMIYTAVRDEKWATAPFTITDEMIEENNDVFSISYTALYHLNDIHYKAAIQIEGKENAISFSMQGEALSNFLRNRIGICVHHPIAECAGKKVEIVHPDGSTDSQVFPELISPHQPFKKIQQMRWNPGPASTAVLNFEGDVFETEDQRNWTDYSYKTYSTPLEIPFPVQVKKGDKVEQKVALSIVLKEGEPVPRIQRERSGSPALFPFPKIGYERAPGSQPLTADDVLILQELVFDHYRVVLRLSDSAWIDELELAAAEARVLNVSIEAVVFFSSASTFAWQDLTNALERISSQLASVLLLQEGKPVTPSALLHQVYPAIKLNMPHVKVGFGTDGFFAELNRNRPSPDLPFDFICFGLNPQVHASDTRTILENLDAQGDTIKLIKAFAPGKEVFVSPVTFRIRSDQQAADEDNRMYTSFGAMWTLLSLKNLAGADRITFYQAKSYRGIINEEIPPGKVPLYTVLKQLKNFHPTILVFDTAGEKLLFENEQGKQMTFSFLKGKTINDLLSGRP